MTRRGLRGYHLDDGGRIVRTDAAEKGNAAARLFEVALAEIDERRRPEGAVAVPVVVAVVEGGRPRAIALHQDGGASDPASLASLLREIADDLEREDLADHVLREGRPLCLLARDPTTTWLPGYRWLRDGEPGAATCRACIALLREPRR